MNAVAITCPICKLEDQGANAYDFGRKKSIQCARCGRYSITSTAQAMIGEGRPSYKLIAWIRDNNEQENDPPEITSNVLRNLENSIPNYSPSQKQLILMRNIERHTKFPGHAVNIVPEYDYPLSWATNVAELLYYLQNLVDRNFLRLPEKAHEKVNTMVNIVEIAPLGWEYLEKNEDKSTFSDQAFVAMSFSPEFKSAWENAIKPAIQRAGYKAYRVDSQPHSDRIDTKIMTEIKNSRFLLADVTEQKQGVYFEAGYALGLSIPVIWSCRKDDISNVHFDTRQYNHILWENEKELEEVIYNFVCAIIGKYTRS